MAPGVSPANQGPSLAGVLQFLGASSIVAILTWSLTNFINHKSNQQTQLNSFISIISDLMINKGLDAPGPQALMPPVSRAAHGFALNTLENLNGAWPIGDPEKKEELLKFLYDSRMIGYCQAQTVGAHNLHRHQTSNRCLAPRVDLKDAKLMDLRLGSVGSVLMGIDLSQAKLQRSNLRALDLRDANFATSDLSGADLRQALLNASDLSQASLIGANLAGASVSAANLSGSQLCAADLRQVTGLESANLEGASFDKSTRLSPDQLVLLVKRGARFRPCLRKSA